VNHGIKHISIPKPCTQNWADMHIVAQGGFCQSCQKTVIDFTKLSNEEILTTLLSTDSACGRFSPVQLSTLNASLYASPIPGFSWKKFGMVAAFIGFVPFINAKGKTRPQVYQSTTQHSDSTQSEINAADSAARTYVIAGQVLDSRDNLALIGASIEVNGTFTTADIDGNFKMNLTQLPEKFVCKIKYIGFKYKEVSLNRQEDNSRLVIKLDEVAGLLGEVIVVRRPPLWKRPYYAVRRLIHKIFS